MVPTMELGGRKMPDVSKMHLVDSRLDKITARFDASVDVSGYVLVNGPLCRLKGSIALLQIAQAQSETAIMLRYSAKICEHAGLQKTAKMLPHWSRV